MRFAAGLIIGAASVGCSLIVSVDGLSSEPGRSGGDGGKMGDGSSNVVSTTDGGDSTSEAGTPLGDAGNACAAARSTPGLILYYPFDETTGTTVHDCSVTGADGTFGGAPDLARVTVAGKVGTALSFDGTGTCISVPVNDALAISGAFTLAAWVWVEEFPSTDSVAAVAGRTTSTGKNGWRFGADLGGVFDLKLGAPGSAYFDVNSPPVATRTWKHAVTTFTPSANAAIYFDGVQSALETRDPPAAITPTSANLRVGCLDGSNFFRGIIDELKLFNRVLDAAEIAALAK